MCANDCENNKKREALVWLVEVMTEQQVEQTQWSRAQQTLSWQAIKLQEEINSTHLWLNRRRLPSKRLDHW